MIGSGIVDLALGMLFVFLVFSLLVSAVNEGITQILAWRSRHLWRALRRILDGDGADLNADQRPKVNAEPGPSWTDRLYAHPLIRQLERRVPTTRSRLPRIPATDFSRALIDLLVPDSGGATTTDQMRAAVRALPGDSALKAPLLAILTEAGDRIDQLRQGIGDWFDARMGALSRAYKQHVRWVLVGVGLVVAMAFNVDAIGAAKQLYRDEALRTAVAGQAISVVAECQEQADPVQCTRDQVGKVDPAIRLPVGWPDQDGIDALQVLGWLVAAVALGQGAPFWFDLLRRAGKLKG